MHQRRISTPPSNILNKFYPPVTRLRQYPRSAIFLEIRAFTPQPYEPLSPRTIRRIPSEYSDSNFLPLSLPITNKNPPIPPNTPNPPLPKQTPFNPISKFSMSLKSRNLPPMSP